MSEKNKIIVWFRLDLRLKDNPALYNAVKDSDEIIPVFILNPEDNNYIGSAQSWWLHHSLLNLQKDFEKYNQKLIILTGNYKDEILKIIENNNINSVYSNDAPTPYFLNYDKKLKKLLESKDIEFKVFNNYLLHDKDLVLNKSGGNYKVFTPFWRVAQELIMVSNILPVPKFKAKSSKIKNIDNKKIIALNLLPKNPDWSEKFKTFWSPGEVYAHKQLKKFINKNIFEYKKARDFPALEINSQLSPYIHFGEISINLIYQKITELLKNNKHNINIITFLSQLGWREFSYNLIFYYPNLAKKDLNNTLENFKWEKNRNFLKLWQQGKTGFPIVDAGMRQLWQTGYMHNRVRMIVASFLTKDLQVDWRVGEKWFFDTLLDYDMANNSAGWQWVAGCGADAAPYFRVFNPILQSKKFDIDGEYIKKWVPELSSVPGKYIHDPLKYKDKLKDYGVELGLDYPFPIVDHDAMRKKYLNIHKDIRGN